MTTLSRRLRLLEEHARPVTQRIVRIFQADEVVACNEHLRCGVERSTGIHHPVIQLSWEVLS